ncbi:MAG: diacylglycerol kinase family protein [Chloroflexota bacterium]|nr:diacylglycerol kinase family protein [Chloroflexota bacterium]
MRSRNILEAFRFAFAGLGYVLRTQRNVHIHLTIAAGAVALGLCLGLSPAQWAILALTIGFVLVSEMLNTVAEVLVDLVSPGYHILAKVAKDMMAGVVLLAAIISVIVGLLVLGPPLWAWIFRG